MCKWIIATLPSDTNIAALERAVPDDLKLKLLRGGLQEKNVSSQSFGFTPFSNLHLQSQMPCNDQLVLTTRLHCDCWTTLATASPSRNEVQRWRHILRRMLEHIDRFGLIIHFGDPNDQFILAGPEYRSLEQGNCLHGLLLDTMYEFALS
jgi:hypothetical protein